MQNAATTLALIAAAAITSVETRADEPLLAYGPGGPAPAMKEAAEVFSKSHGVGVAVTAGPTPAWIAKARHDADVIFSGAEYMMTDFMNAMEGRIDASTVESLYLRSVGRSQIMQCPTFGMVTISAFAYAAAISSIAASDGWHVMIAAS
jgi:accessory colonization factor AcfC